MSRVELVIAQPGTTVELRAADGPTPPVQIDTYRVLDTTRSGAGATVLTPPAGTSARYYVVWVAALPAVQDHFSSSVASLRVFRG